MMLMGWLMVCLERWGARNPHHPLRAVFPVKFPVESALVSRRFWVNRIALCFIATPFLSEHLFLFRLYGDKRFSLQFLTEKAIFLNFTEKKALVCFFPRGYTLLYGDDAIGSGL